MSTERVIMINKNDIENAEKELVLAIKTSDLAKLDRTIHDDLLCLVPNGGIITKAMDFESHRRGDMKVERLEMKVEQINLADDLAISVVVYETSGTMLGQPITGKFRYLRTWKKFADRLKVVSAACFQVS
jgi:ketosteroid isomerase-like protein